LTLARPIIEGEPTEAYRAKALFHAHHDDPEIAYRYLADGAADAAGYSAATKSSFAQLRSNVLDRLI